MTALRRSVRVLYSFPHKLGADRICYTAWQQVNGLAAAGAEVLVWPGVLHRPVPSNVRVETTLSRGRLRLPYKLFGTRRACVLHDYIVARRLEKLAGKIDLIHGWPLGSRQTFLAARRFGIPTFLERPNAHTQFAYEAVQKECERLGIRMPAGHEHAYNAEVLEREEQEYALADHLLCPSDFVAQTFRERGFPDEKLSRHQYGFDDKTFYAPAAPRARKGLAVIFAGGCAPRKGLHYALEAWKRSGAHENGGVFLIAGGFIPEYRQKLEPLLAQPGVQALGHRRDVPDLMRESDILILPTVEEGSALVTSEARGAGCVLLVSDAAGAICQHMENALVHKAGDVDALTQHLTMLRDDRALLERLRAASLRTVDELTWTAAGRRLLDAYEEGLQAMPVGGNPAPAMRRAVCD